MPPRRRGGFGSTHLLDMTVTVYDWAPPGWHWEESGVRRLVRNPGPVIDPDLVWWHLCGPGVVQREPAPEEVVQRHIREEDAHVRRYMYLLEREYRGSWSFVQRDPYHVSYDPVRVPSLWVSTTTRASAPGRRLGRSVRVTLD